MAEAGASAPETERRRRARVAVIGAGAAGLAAARELTREGHDAVVFEQGAELGGVWVYDADVEDDLTGANANRAKRVHSSVYKSLRTNLPREVMGFASFPFTRAFTDDARRFCGHEEVRAYLDAYADHHDIRRLVRLGERVVAVTPTPRRRERRAAEDARFSGDDERRADRLSATSNEHTDARSVAFDLEKWGPRWRVETEPAGPAGPAGPAATGARAGEAENARRDARVADFDAVVVCNGHYSEPRSPSFPGSERWPGTQMHSHNYREPEGAGGGFSFRGKRVVVLGAMASGEDLSREIASVAAEVTLASRGFAPPSDASSGDFPLDSYPENMRRAPGIAALLPDTSGVAFEDGSVRHDVDVVLYATGYHVTFPFFASFAEPEARAGADDSSADVSAADVSTFVPRSVDNRVSPLFEHVFPPLSAPSLSFIGLPWKVVPFPQFEAQARWIAKTLSGAATLPGRDEMARAAAEAEARDRNDAVADRHAHRMGSAQFAYNDRLLAYCGEPGGFPKWREAMYVATGARKRAFPASYRDGPDAPWSDEEALREARAEASALGFAEN